MIINELENSDIKLVIKEILSKWKPVLPKYMYHVTKEKNVNDIMASGLITRKYGEVHGTMEITPPSPAIYISDRPESNNLNTNLSGNDLVSFKIDTSFIDIKNVYVDDGFYVAFGNEDVFEDAEEVSESLQISIESASILLDYLESLQNDKIVIKTKFLLGWYIEHHGELAITQNIPPEAIVEINKIKNPFG